MDKIIPISRDQLTKSSPLQSNEQGLYYLGEDMTENGSRVTPKDEKWKCPYCNLYWKMGQMCENEKCPTNRWDKEKDKIKEKDKK